MRLLFYTLIILFVNSNTAYSQDSTNYYGEEFSTLDIKNYSINKFNLGRPDKFPLEDIGMIRGLCKCYNLKYPIDRKKLIIIGKFILKQNSSPLQL